MYWLFWGTGSSGILALPAPILADFEGEEHQGATPLNLEDDRVTSAGAIDCEPKPVESPTEPRPMKIEPLPIQPTEITPPESTGPKPAKVKPLPPVPPTPIEPTVKVGEVEVEWD